MIAFPCRDLHANQLPYSLGDLINRFRVRTLNLDPISPLWGHVLLARLKVPFTYCWSQELIPKPKDWGPHINITGFSFLSLASSYKPADDLAEFLAAGPPPVYIGFGSIVVDNPNELTKLIFNAVKKAGVRALVSKGWGGLGEDNAPEGVFMLGNCPHDWLFKHVSAVVHHGGAGTTAIGLALGKPTVVVPFFGDQPFWGAMIYKAGAGPEPVPFKKMTEDTLASSIQQALGPGIQTAAEKMGETIRSEKPGALEAAKSFQSAINLDSMRCYLAPDKLAVWRIKNTNLPLSGLAVGLLIENKHVQIGEIKLMRHIDWYMDEGAEGPFIGAAAAFAETFMSVINSIEDYFRALSRTFQAKPSGTQISPDGSIELSDAANAESKELYQVPTNIDFQDVDNHDVNFEHRIDHLAWHMATKTTKDRKKKSRSCLPGIRTKNKKSIQSTGPSRRSTNGPRPSNIGPRPSQLGPRPSCDIDHGVALEAAYDTTMFARSMVEAWLKAPVAFFYNVANGLHNFPSYVLHDDTVRRRENITGLGSGAKVAAKGWGFGMYDAITGLVTQPYIGAKKEGAAGFGKGIGKGVGGLVFKTVAAQFGLIGYTLKGIEKQVLKRRSRDLKARIIAVRLRQGHIEYQRATPEEKQAILDRWDKVKDLVRSV
ncbi:glycosyltransferase family 28 domain-containing protein [Phlyctema vagabunda]|uniref:Glycosyltransferase family 28 domain-containing protein n=1 Tax=Phlyctema vagabunda TaxID=108571 RepID=A0ABR4P7F1_9HELO